MSKAPYHLSGRGFLYTALLLVKSFYGCNETTTRADHALVIPVQVTGVVLA
jgi:hypothetical protein